MFKIICLFLLVLLLINCGGENTPPENPQQTISVDWDVLNIYGSSISSFIIADNGVILASTGGKLYLSDVKNQKWQALDALGTKLIKANDGTIITDKGYRSYDHGQTWQELDSKERGEIYYNPYDNNLLLINSTKNQLFLSNDFGDSWQFLADFPQNITSITSVTVDPTGNIFAATLGDDKSSLWQLNSARTQWLSFPLQDIFNSVYADPNGNIYASSNKLYKKSTQSNKWQQLSIDNLNGGSHEITDKKELKILGADHQGKLWVGAGSELYPVLNNGLGTMYADIELAYLLQQIHSMDDKLYLSSLNGIWQIPSTNESQSAVTINKLGIPKVKISKLHIDNEYILAGVQPSAGNGYLTEYNINDNQWQHKAFYHSVVNDISVQNNEIIIATSSAEEPGYGFLAKLKNDNSSPQILTNIAEIKAVQVGDKGELLILTGLDASGVNSFKIMLSENSGHSWQDITRNIPSSSVPYDLLVFKDEILLATNKGLYLTKITRSAWQRVKGVKSGVHGLYRRNNMVIAWNEKGIFQRGIFKRGKSNRQWKTITKNLPVNSIKQAVIDSKKNIWIAGDNGLFVKEVGSTQWRNNRTEPLINVAAHDDIIISGLQGQILKGRITN